MSSRSEPGPGGDRAGLRADCESCFALCCVAPEFAASADFAIDKEPGRPCPNLDAHYRCAIHTRLRSEGFPGCAVYDCFGAGQKVSRVTFGGRDWRGAPETARGMFEAFGVMRQLHELLWYLTEARALEPARPLHGELRVALDETERLTYGTAASLSALDVAAHREGSNALLVRASELARAEIPHPKEDRRGEDLIGADLRGENLRGASLRGALLVGADLRDADLRVADVTGADLRGADLGGADLTGTLFLTQSQLDAAKGDAGTKLPSSLMQPAHWG